jgi:hypothetical protein
MIITIIAGAIAAFVPPFILKKWNTVIFNLITSVVAITAASLLFGDTITAAIWSALLGLLLSFVVSSIFDLNGQRAEAKKRTVVTADEIVASKRVGYRHFE